MGLDVRPVSGDDLDRAIRLFFTAIVLGPPNLDQRHHDHPALAGRTLGAFVDGELVGTAGSLPWAMVVPGGDEVRTAGVTRVGVLPTHTRRGIVSTLMREQLADIASRGEVLASLRASESVIYGRFGYGAATHYADYRLERARATFRAPVVDHGSFRLLDRSELDDVLPAVYARSARRPGAVDRPAWSWPFRLRELRGDASPTRWVVAHLDAAGVPDGYADYEAVERDRWEQVGSPIEVHDLWAVDDATTAALWRWLLDLDLGETLRLSRRPVDEPLRWLLADPRRLETTRVEDEAWVRLVDVGGALGARTYAPVDGVVIDVADPLLPANAGTWEVDGDGVRRTDRAADLAVDVSVLGAVSLGGTSWAELAAGGRVEERTTGAIERADRLFSVHPAPWCGTFF
jgi:predicted acetyltransferase